MKLKNLETIGEPKKDSGCYPSPFTDVSYRDDAYRSFVQQIRAVRNSVKDLPEELRDDVGKMLEQAVRGTLDASRVIYDSLIDGEKLKSVDGDYLTDMRELDKLPNEFVR